MVERKNNKSIRQMGEHLKRVRLERGHTQQDVASALGKGFQYVSDVENGRRGHQMAPLTAMVWAEYLAIDPQVLFDYLEVGKTGMDRLRVRHYMETGKWANRFLLCRRALLRAETEVKALLPLLREKTPEKLAAYQLRDSILAARNAVHIPRNGEEREAEPCDPQQLV